LLRASLMPDNLFQLFN